MTDWQPCVNFQTSLYTILHLARIFPLPSIPTFSSPSSYQLSHRMDYIPQSPKTFELPVVQMYFSSSPLRYAKCIKTTSNLHTYRL